MRAAGPIINASIVKGPDGASRGFGKVNILFKFMVLLKGECDDRYYLRLWLVLREQYSCMMVENCMAELLKFNLTGESHQLILVTRKNSKFNLINI